MKGFGRILLHALATLSLLPLMLLAGLAVRGDWYVISYNTKGWSHGESLGFLGVRVTEVDGPGLVGHHDGPHLIYYVRRKASVIGAIAFAVLPMWRGTVLVRGRVQMRRRRLGLCPYCGYDLRATSDRCPECGTDASRTDSSKGRPA